LAPWALDRARAFFLDVMNGNVEMTDWLQRMLGYCLTGRTDERSLFLWWGAGHNGKGTVSNLMQSILGPLYVTCSKDVFIQSARGTSAGSATPHLMPLRAAVRMCVFSESDKEEKLNQGQLKALTGDDAISARALYGQQVTLRPVCKMIMQTNHKPHFDVADEAMVNRLKFVPFAVAFVPEPKQPHERLRDPERVRALHTTGLDEVFTWVATGALAWYRHGLHPAPAYMQSATMAYLDELDTIGQFIQEECCEEPKSQISGQALRQRYEQWCQVGGHAPLTVQAFGSRMKRRCEHRKCHGVVTYAGLRLRNERVDPDPDPEGPTNF
jgi:putative DNA primase/helicase